MRAETKLRLERALWRERAKWIGAGLAVCIGMAGLFAWISADHAVEKVRIPATVMNVRPMPLQTGQTGLLVDVKLPDGKSIELMVNQITDPKVGQTVEIIEHRHATGRRTHSWK